MYAIRARRFYIEFSATAIVRSTDCVLFGCAHAHAAACVFLVHAREHASCVSAVPSCQLIPELTDYCVLTRAARGGGGSGDGTGLSARVLTDASTMAKQSSNESERARALASSLITIDVFRTKPPSTTAPAFHAVSRVSCVMRVQTNSSSCCDPARRLWGGERF